MKDIKNKMITSRDTDFKALGYQNVYMPLFIPKTLLPKEAEHETKHRLYLGIQYQ